MLRILLAILILTAVRAHAIEPFASYFYFSEHSSGLEQAEILIIGEDHDVSQDQAIEVKILDQYAQPGDILLLEGVGNTVQFNSIVPVDYLKRASQSLLIGGWDNEAAFNRHLMKLALIQRAVRPDSDFVDKATVPFLAIYNIATLWRDISIRNASMRYALRKLSADVPHKKIFIIAGSNHIEDHPELIPALDSIKRPYAVLMPVKQNPLRIHDLNKEYTSRNYGF